jgi:hypothetical protein
MQPKLGVAEIIAPHVQNVKNPDTTAQLRQDPDRQPAEAGEDGEAQSNAGSDAKPDQGGEQEFHGQLPIRLPMMEIMKVRPTITFRSSMRV